MTENVPPGSAGKAGPAPTSEATSRGLPYYEKLRRDLRDTLQKKRVLDKNMASLEDSIYHHESKYLEETSTAGNIVKGFDNYIKSSHHHHHYNNSSNNNHLNPNSGLSLGSATGLGGTISGSAAGGGAGGGGSAQPPMSGSVSGRRKTAINDMDRIFSRSSTSYYNNGMRDSDSPSSATTTPGHAPTPATGGFAATQQQQQQQTSGQGGTGGSERNQNNGGNNNNKKKKKKKKQPSSATAAGGGQGEESESTDAKPANKRARITYGPRE